MLSLNPTKLLENPKAQDASMAKIPEDITMGNEQVTREEIGWLAGIIDGEGYLGITSRKDRRRVGYYLFGPELHISNTDESIILKCQSIIRKLGVNPYIRATKANSKIRKDQYRLSIYRTNKLQKVVIPVYPYLTGIKQERAKLVLEFIRLRETTPWTWIKPNNKTHQSGPKKIYSPREIEIIIQCRDLQRRGTSETVRRAQRLTSEIWKIMESRQQEVVKA